MNLTIEFLKKHRIEFSVSVEGEIKVGGSLYLSSVTSLPEGFNPTVGGSLYLSSVTSLPEGFNPTVGGYLDLSSVTSLPEGFNPTVGGSLYLSSFKGKKPDCKNIPQGFSASLRLSIETRFNAKGFTVADGILARIIQARGPLKKIIVAGKKECTWLASSDDGIVHAHGDTAAEALAELAFKLADKGDLSDLRAMPMDTVKTPQEWGLVYRRATGACKSGTKHFMAQKVTKESYTLAEILEETKGAFGAERFREVVGA
ncbi:MAG: hypothetical protein WC130_03785 [Kiritimatiellia bacterium]